MQFKMLIDVLRRMPTPDVACFVRAGPTPRSGGRTTRSRLLTEPVIDLRYAGTRPDAQLP
ncbi:hypothetical protein [Actinomadura macra]|uniref:hypothetical protein n=1 Tax=Actinomadura macra TaxID=46164 RepID=UPI0012FB9200|nr:hypothetical protein [Actinomadura macra]